MTPPDPADPTGTSAVIGPDPATNPARAPQPSADERTGDPATLAAATQAMRQRPVGRMSDRVLSKALTATRRSLPVRPNDLGRGRSAVRQRASPHRLRPRRDQRL